MRSAHVLVYERDRENKVQVERVHDVGDEADADCQSSILEVRQLDVHRSELNAPSDI